MIWLLQQDNYFTKNTKSVLTMLEVAIASLDNSIILILTLDQYLRVRDLPDNKTNNGEIPTTNNFPSYFTAI